MGSGASSKKQFGALPSEPDGSTSLQRSQRVRSMEMDEVIRVKAKVVTSEGEGVQRSTRVTSLEVFEHLRGSEAFMSHSDSECQSPDVSQLS